MSMERIDIRVEAEILEELEDLARLDNHNTRSEAVREAIYNYVDDMKGMWNSDVVKVTIPKRLMDKVGLYIRNGDAQDLDQAIFLAMNKWCDDLEDYYSNRRDKMEKIVSENVAADLAKGHAKKQAKKMARR
ncbi:MAG: ribbon-helix-helix protein, CopG family [Thermoplasmata archaeon]|nr:ribbon-helix-helix protein, CopG family [Thermoplasmata archaeon]